MNASAQHTIPVRTTCPYCGVGCGVLAKPDGAGGAAISGDPQHPANFGQLCSKGSALGETLGLDSRLLHPMVRSKSGEMKPASWDAALDAVAAGLSRTIAEYGPDAVAFYLSGQLLTEDYYVANKLMKGFIGSANVDTNSRLCMASSVAGHRRAFGSDTVPGNYQDLDQADLIILTGSNAAWCHPVLFRRIMRNRTERGAKVVVIDPRRTSTAEEVDLFLPIAPGMDTALFSGLLVHLAESAAFDTDFVDRHTAGLPDALMAARAIAPDIAMAASLTRLSEGDVARFFALFRDTDRVVTCYSQGVNQSAQGTDKVNAIINCHLATGRLGKPGMGPLSLTGQPNAMGGREVGGLANQLAAHMGFSPVEIDRVRRFWTAPAMARREGRKAVEMFDAMAQGEIKALWVMATNPAVSLPRANAVREGLGTLDLLVVSDNVLNNDTIACGAHVLLPAAAWGEKSGTVTNSERRISRQRAFLAMPGDAKPDWWIVCEVAKRLDFADAFSYGNAADIFREHAALSAFENDGTRDFDLGAYAAISNGDYAAFEPSLWGGDRFFADGRFFTRDRRARFVAVARPVLHEPITDVFPLRLNTGRVRDQWHTMTRSGLSYRLAEHSPVPTVDIHPDDAARYGLRDRGFARVMTAHGSCVLRVRFNDGQSHGHIFAPIHWSDDTSSCGRVGALASAATDPVSGQPELKGTAAAVTPVAYRMQGFVIARSALRFPARTWWARVAVKDGVGYVIASHDDTATWQRWSNDVAAGHLLMEYLDPASETYRVASIRNHSLDLCVFIGTDASAQGWDALKALLAENSILPHQQTTVLSGQALDGVADCGPLVCACYGVGMTTLRDALRARQVNSVDDIGRTLKAGTNCGSCLPELKRIVTHEHTALAD